MPRWLARNVAVQLGLLVGFSVTAAALGYYLDYRPRVGFGVEHIWRGFVAAPLLVAAVGVAHGVLLAAGRFGHARSMGLERELLARAPITARIAAGITAACGEELLVRIYLFGYLALYSLPMALSVNAAVTFLLYFRGKRRMSWTAVRVVEGTVAALIFWAQHSFLGLVIARGLSYAILTACTLSPAAAPLISASVKAWRKPHALFRKALESASKRSYPARSV